VKTADTATSPGATQRRTQTERREGTIRKLLDAATSALIDLGYAGASVQAICTRAGVSQGALFRHFPTREALLVAVCQDLGGRVLASYQERFRARKGSDPLVDAMHLLRQQCRSRENQAFYELALAARTNPELARALAPVSRQYYDDIERLARELLPDLAETLGPRFRVLVDTIVCAFDGEALRRVMLDDEEMDAERIETLRAALGALLALPPRRS
jgi:AcrR family transcriptional regulator